MWCGQGKKVFFEQRMERGGKPKSSHFGFCEEKNFFFFEAFLTMKRDNIIING